MDFEAAITMALHSMCDAWHGIKNKPKIKRPVKPPIEGLQAAFDTTNNVLFTI